jgi:hypothetical protein
MVSTITSVTVSPATLTASASFVLIAVITLLILLIQKELIGNLGRAEAKRFSRALNAAIMPLMIVFVTSLVIQIAETLR